MKKHLSLALILGLSATAAVAQDGTAGWWATNHWSKTIPLIRHPEFISGSLVEKE